MTRRSGTNAHQGQAASSAEKHSLFILGSPIPDPKTLQDDQFAAAVNTLFYNLILIHSEHLYADIADQVMARLFSCNLSNLDEEELHNLEAWFCDRRLIDILKLLQVYYFYPDDRHALAKEVSAQYTPTEKEFEHLYQDSAVAQSQVWASFIGLNTSILNLLIKMREEKSVAKKVDDERLQDLKKAKKKINNHKKIKSQLKLLKSEEPQTDGNLKIQKRLQFAKGIIVDFLHKRINDIRLKTVDFCFYLTDQEEEYRRKEKSNFNYPDFIYNVLFNPENRGFLTNIRVDNIEKWIGDFFCELLLTLEHFEKKATRDSEITVKSLDESFHRNEEALLAVLNSIAKNELETLKEVHAALLQILNDPESFLKLLAAMFPKQSNSDDLVEPDHLESIDYLKEIKQSVWEHFLEAIAWHKEGGDEEARAAAGRLYNQLLDRNHLRVEEPVSKNTGTPVYCMKPKPPGKKKDTSLTVGDIFWICLGTVLFLAAAAAAIYLTIQTLGIAPVALTSALVLGVASGAFSSGAATAILIGLRKKIGAFFRDLLSSSPTNKKLPNKQQTRSRALQGTSPSFQAQSAATKPALESPASMSASKRPKPFDPKTPAITGVSGRGAPQSERDKKSVDKLIQSGGVFSNLRSANTPPTTPQNDADDAPRSVSLGSNSSS